MIFTVRISLCWLLAFSFCLAQISPVRAQVEDEIDVVYEELFEEDFLDDFTWIDSLDALDGVNETELLDDFEIEIEQNRLSAVLDEWIIIASPGDLPAIRGLGASIDRVENLVGLDLIIARVITPANQTLAEFRAAVLAVAPEAEVDLNHVYRPQSNKNAANGMKPRALLTMPKGVTGRGLRIGIIDTEIDRSHPVLKNVNLKIQDFVRGKLSRPNDHGTAVLSILAAQGETYLGLLPDAEYFAGSVFFSSKKGGRTATTDSLIRAISWMKENNVPVINMSLTGPPNRVLKKAIKTAVSKKTIVIAAIGNDGPNAAPLYPAAYTDVIGVTAVSKSRKVYRLAGRGNHVDFSAPGVGVLHAGREGLFETSSGTSLAAPFVTAAIVMQNFDSPTTMPDILLNLKSTALDLGEKGFDTTYGYGLIQLETSIVRTTSSDVD